MKASRAFALIVAAFGIGFLAARWRAEQPALQTSPNHSTTDPDLPLRQLNSLVSYLQNAKQTNALQQFTNYMNTSLSIQQTADIGLTLGTLQRLRDGRTNAAMELLEGRLSADIVVFADNYRALPESIREDLSLKPLEYARDYRAEFPFKNTYPKADEAVARAFKILDDKTAR